MYQIYLFIMELFEPLAQTKNNLVMNVDEGLREDCGRWPQVVPTMNRALREFVDYRLTIIIIKNYRIFSIIYKNYLDYNIRTFLRASSLGRISRVNAQCPPRIKFAIDPEYMVIFNIPSSIYLVDIVSTRLGRQNGIGEIHRALSLPIIWCHKSWDKCWLALGRSGLPVSEFEANLPNPRPASIVEMSVGVRDWFRIISTVAVVLDWCRTASGGIVGHPRGVGCNLGICGCSIVENFTELLKRVGVTGVYFLPFPDGIDEVCGIIYNLCEG